LYICGTILKAIHNKDYSVVKTFKVAGFISCHFFFLNVSRTPIKTNRKASELKHLKWQGLFLVAFSSIKQ